jgi:reactive intermediate/imine deaminase
MSRREAMRVPGLPEPLSHYTDAVRFGDLLLVSGCAPLDEDGNLRAEGDVVGQTRAVLEAMDRILRHAGATFADVLKVTVFMTDISQRREANTVREEFFGTARPASTLIEVSALAVPGMLIEIEAIVGLPE